MGSLLPGGGARRDRAGASLSFTDAVAQYADEVRELGGIVDYTVGPSAVKVFCLAEHSDPKQRHYLSLYKLGDGPLYPFWIPYHLPHIETPNAIARVVLFCASDMSIFMSGSTLLVDGGEAA